MLYVPLETWVSLPGLTSPSYLIDLIAMVLLFAGAMHSLRERPRPAPGLLCAAIAWAAANGRRATFRRLAEQREGGSLDYGSTEMWTVAISTGISLAGLALPRRPRRSRSRVRRTPFVPEHTAPDDYGSTRSNTAPPSSRRE